MQHSDKESNPSKNKSAQEDYSCMQDSEKESNPSKNKSAQGV
jgi:hypothetical protein